MPVYLNTYETYQAYGGPEEGGWWYECGEPVQSVLLSDEDYEEWRKKIDAETDALLEKEDYTTEKYNSVGNGKCRELCRKATLAYTEGRSPTPKKTGYGGYTFVVGSEDTPSTYQEDDSYSTIIEGHFAIAYPQERPYYC